MDRGRATHGAVDPSATSRQPDASNPDQSRFAVPVSAMELGDFQSSDTFGDQPFTTKTRLYRVGKDNHGQVACSACHGAGHAIWPNRDPSANDNVTALQLQGHSGPIAECSVCHTADAFAKFEDLDEGLKASNSTEYVLGGPHNMHPVSLTDAPSSMSIDEHSGQISWLAQVDVSTDVMFSVNASDGQGGTAKQNLHLLVCATPETFGTNATGNPACLSPIEFTAIPNYGVTAGQIYSYQAIAVHANGLGLTYSLAEANGSPMPAGITIDTQTGVVNWLATAQPDTGGYAVFNVVATDVNGYSVTQEVDVMVCDSFTVWDGEWGACRGPVIITSKPPVSGLNVDDSFDYQVAAADYHPDAGAIKYSLIAVPDIATIDPDSGWIHWKAVDLTDNGGYISFTVTATDTLRNTDTPEPFGLTVCIPPYAWDEVSQGCITP